MTLEAASARNAMPSEDRERIRACSIALASGSQLLGNLQWSDLGQALVVMDDVLSILSPLTGLHPDLAKQSRVQDIESHPSWQGCFPHSIAQINIKSFLEDEDSIRSRTIIESDYSVVDPRFQSARWASASWSNPGMGPHGSCLILATTSELDLFVIGPPLNTWTGEWKLLHAIDMGPVAAQTELDTPIQPIERSEIFTESRALLRKKQLAKEVLSACFLSLEATSEQPQQASALVVAGTKSGHIVIWECAPVSGHCKLVSATPVSSTGIEKLSATTRVDALAPRSRGRIVLQDADSVRVCDIFVEEGHTVVRLSEAPPVQSHHSMVSAMHWNRHHFVYATIGKVHVHDFRSEQTQVHLLAVGPDSDFDPFSPIISIEDRPHTRDSVKVVLQDLREYHIPLVIHQNESSTRDILPIYPTKLTGYPPLTENLQRKHDHYQAFLGYQTQPGSVIAGASIVGSVRTQDRVAFLGYDVSDTISYQLEIAKSGNVALSEVVKEALQRVSAGIAPYLLVRTMLALLYTSQQQAVFRTQLLSAVEGRWRVLVNSQSDSSSSAQQQLLYLLSCRLEDSSPDTPSELDSLKKQYRESVLRNWIHHWLSDLSERQSAYEEDRRLLSRLTAAHHLLPSNPQHVDELAATGEECAACQAQLSLSWDEQRQDFGWTKCQKGHVWPRCSVSLATISDREVRVCSGCWAKALLPTEEQDDWQTLILQLAPNCLYCGSLWILR